MFRGCYFEFAGKSSEPYNLMLFYKDNKRDDFNSGGEYELKTDSIPYSEEQFLYGKDYSEKPLEFEVEIVTPEGNIPQMQMVEIKNWLFGQTGWKDLTVTDDTQSYHLKCVLIPSEDITDCNGYRGLRCTIHNASPFWYGDEREILINVDSEDTVYWNSAWYSFFNVEIPDNGCVDAEIYPIINFDINKTVQGTTNGNTLTLYNTAAQSITQAKSLDFSSGTSFWTYKNTSSINCDISFIGDSGSSSAYDTITFNSKFATLSSARHTKQEIFPALDTSNSLKLFRLKRGTNICRLRDGDMFSSVGFKYIPLYRMGAF